MKLLFRKSVLICTLFIFGFLFVLKKIPAQFDVLDPIGKALTDFEMSDLVFSQLRGEQQLDTNIVLVNIGDLSRAEIGKQISIINSYQPKVIGVDVMFRSKKSFDQDIQLIMGMSQVENLVLVTDLSQLNKAENCFDSIETSHPQFNQFATNGFADLKTAKDSYRTVRKFLPSFCVKDTVALSFASKLAQVFDPSSVEDLLARKNELEIINWRGDNKKFYRLDAQQVLDEEGDFSFLKDKIVILGFLGHHELGETSLDDTFYTPLNKQSAGRANPDMYGVTVHANIVSMILNRTYINYPPKWVDSLIAFILVYLNVAVFIYIANRFKVYYDLVTKFLIIGEVIILFAANLYILLILDIKINLTLTIIAIAFSGDLTELYIGSLRDLTVIWARKIGIDLTPYIHENQ